MTPSLQDIVDYLDSELRTASVRDYPNALNGLQLQNDGTVSRIAMAVDASEKAINEAIGMKADLLVVHHGLYWGGLQPITGSLWRKIDAAIKNNLAIYSSHLPLDQHAVNGNNSRIIFECGMEQTGEGFPFLDAKLGMQALFRGSIAELLKRIEKATGRAPCAYIQTPLESNPGKIMVCSGGAGDEINDVAKMGIQTYVTGEGGHWTIPLAAELGVNLIYAGHYETETFGVKAMGEILHRKFGLPAEFIPMPPSSYNNA